MKLKVWQIVLSAVAGVAVVGGGATGIWYGVTHSSADPAMEPAASIVESGTDAQALDEPTATAPVSTEEETKTSTEKQTTKESTSESVTSTTEGTIRFEYDPDLSREIAILLQEKFDGIIYDNTIQQDIHPENFINLYYNEVKSVNDNSIYIGKENTAQDIISAWSECDPIRFLLFSGPRFSVQSYRYSNGYIATYIV